MAVTGVLAQRLQTVQDRIAKAAVDAGRSPDEVRLLPVTKTHPPETLIELAGLGFTCFGENRVQEMTAKDAALRDVGVEPTWALIGPLQTNKAKAAVLASEFHALESLRVAEALQRRLADAERRLPVLIEVNTSGEPAKHGMAPDEVAALARSLRPFDALDVRGLMTVAVHSPDRTAVARCFEQLATLQTQLRDDGVLDSDWNELSMGMSNDFELAIAHGATVVRVGSAIFGPRG